MKKLISLCLVSVMVFSLCISADAAPIRIDDPVSLSLQYRHGERVFSGQQVQIYRIASMEENGTFSLCGDFKDYPVNLYGITAQKEWKDVASTLIAYAAADGLTPARTAVTDEEGRVNFEGLEVGLYLTLPLRIKDESGTTDFEGFVTMLPQGKEQSYDVTAYPKGVHTDPQYRELEFKVIKQWRDGGSTARPTLVKVLILKDGAAYSEQILSAANNWCYSWKAPLDGSVWQVVEREVPKGYTVSMTAHEHTLILTNTYGFDEYDPPNTGDTTLIWPYVLVMCIGGILILLLAIRIRRKDK